MLQQKSEERLRAIKIICSVWEIRKIAIKLVINKEVIKRTFHAIYFSTALAMNSVIIQNACSLI